MGIMSLGERMNGNTGIIAAIAVLLTAFGLGLFSGIWVSPESFEGYKSDHDRVEHAQNVRIDAVAERHADDMGNVQKALADVGKELAGVKAGQAAIMTQLRDMREDIRRRPR